MKTTEEKNRMIAEFMGVKPMYAVVDFSENGDVVLSRGWLNREDAEDDVSHFNERYDIDAEVVEEELKYHTSWDWLMPCLSKMTTIKGFQDDYERSFHFWEAHSQFDMDGCYDELVLFIEWYNEQKIN